MRTLFSSLSLANFNLQLLALDCYDGWGGVPQRLALQFALPLLALMIYATLVLCYALLLYLARLARKESPLRALWRMQHSTRLAHALDRTIGAYQARSQSRHASPRLATPRHASPRLATPRPAFNDRTSGASQALLYVMYPMLVLNITSMIDCRTLDDEARAGPFALARCH